MKLLGRSVGLDQPLFLIAGPCVVESEALQLRTAERLKDITDRLGVQPLFPQASLQFQQGAFASEFL